MSVGPTPLEIFRAQGIPHRRMEDWKYTDLRSAVDAETVARAGRLRMTASIPESVERITRKDGKLPERVGIFYDAAADLGAMGAAAVAFEENDLIFGVPSNAKIEKPLRVEMTGAGQGQIILLLERGASLTFVEAHDDDGEGFRNLALSIWLEAGARLTHVRQMPFASKVVTVATILTFQEGHSHYHAHFLNGGAKLSRTELNIELKGEGAEAELSGVCVLGDGAHADITTRIVHAVPNTTSRQLFKYIAGGKSRAVYQGKITVREGAIGSDSRQTAKALLLSNHAEADLKPELEILADDVKCAHGAAVGDLDADSLFYLRSRGIPEKEARALLIEAFLQEVIDGIEDETIRATAADFVKKGLAHAMSEKP